MRVSYHGGQCCAIKTIHGLYGDPTMTLPSNSKPDWAKSPRTSDPFMNRDRRGGEVASDLDPCPLAFPVQTCLQRFDALVDWVKEWRPKGMIEVTLTDAYQTAWYPLLKKRKFKQVAKFINSNSGNVVRVFHLVYGQPKEPRVKKVVIETPVFLL